MTTNNNSEKTLRFVAFGGERDVRHSEVVGSFFKHSTIVELRCLPGNIVSWGYNTCEALENLQEALELAFKYEGSAYKWYQKVMDDMTLTEQKTRSAYASLWFDNIPSEDTFNVIQIPVLEGSL